MSNKKKHDFIQAKSAERKKKQCKYIYKVFTSITQQLQISGRNVSVNKLQGYLYCIYSLHIIILQCGGGGGEDGYQAMQSHNLFRNTVEVLDGKEENC